MFMSTMEQEQVKWTLEKWQNLLENLWFAINQVNDVGAPTFLKREKEINQSTRIDKIL